MHPYKHSNQIVNGCLKLIRTYKIDEEKVWKWTTCHTSLADIEDDFETHTCIKRWGWFEPFLKTLKNQLNARAQGCCYCVTVTHTQEFQWQCSRIERIHFYEFDISKSIRFKSCARFFEKGGRALCSRAFEQSQLKRTLLSAFPVFYFHWGCACRTLEYSATFGNRAHVQLNSKKV